MRNPLGFNRSEFKVYHGTKLAHASLCIMFTTMRTDSLGLLEQAETFKDAVARYLEATGGNGHGRSIFWLAVLLGAFT